jgi:serine/threonine protein kinase
MSPEMIERTGHDKGVDFYGLGAILYEFVIGFPPFYSEDSDAMMHDIVNCKLTFPSPYQLSPELIDLLSKLLNKNPKRRMGNLNGVQEIYE